MLHSNDHVLVLTQSTEWSLQTVSYLCELTRSKKCHFILKQHCWICTSSS